VSLQLPAVNTKYSITYSGWEEYIFIVAI